MGLEGLNNLYKFVQDGGTLITEGSTSTLFPEYNLTPGITVENPEGLFARGTILRGVLSDSTSPVAYGFGDKEIAVYFSQSPVLNAGGAAALAGRGGRGAAGGGLSQNTQPNATPIHLSPFFQTGTAAEESPPIAAIEGGGRGPGGGGAPGAGAGGGGGRGGRGGRGRGGAAADSAGGAARGGAEAAGAPGGGAPDFAGGRGGTVGPPARQALVSKAFSVPVSYFHSPPTPTTCCSQARWPLKVKAWPGHCAQIVDEPIGKGHLVMFAIRPFWRWQTQGTYIFGFNTIMNWNHLDAGRPTAPAGRAGGNLVGLNWYSRKAERPAPIGAGRLSFIGLVMLSAFLDSVIPSAAKNLCAGRSIVP